MGFKEPTPIQEQAIPHILENKDLIACAQTGTGKTAAFLLPIIDLIQREPTDHINALIIVPTRELAVQIDQQLEGFSYFMDVSGVAIYGGSSGANWDAQRNAIQQGADILVATPGRLIQHLRQGYLDVSKIKHLVLDEADRMLDMGFHQDILDIVSNLPKERQTLMFSATMPPKIRKLAKELLNEPEEITIAVSTTAEGVLQGAYMVNEAQKIPVIQSFIEGKEEELPSVVIFCSTKTKVNALDRQLRKQKINCKAIHSDLEQEEREEALRDFKNKKLQVIVATDILARGIDVKDIKLVINYDVPNDPEDYIHRVGRTARADTTGIALTLITTKDQGQFKRIEDLLGFEIKKPALPASFGEQPEYNPKSGSRGGRKGGYRKKGNGRKKTDRKK
ncbi:MAG: DEAD/DEAH box helicase [Cytophagales bacterium]|nr:DEAD/DEAH box helicase [Cytophagales bacterium]